MRLGEAVGEAFRGVDPLYEGAPCVFRYKIERCDAVRDGIVMRWAILSPFGGLFAIIDWTSQIGDLYIMW